MDRSKAWADSDPWHDEDRAWRGASVAEVVDAVWRRKLLVLGAGLLAAFGLVVVGELLPQSYAARAQLLVDPRDLQMLGSEVMPRQLATDNGLAIVESQVEVLISDNVLRKAIVQAGLEHDPEFIGEGESFIGQLRALLPGAASPDEDPVLTVLQKLRKQVTAIRIERSFIIDFTVQSKSREKSTRIAEAVVNSYLEDQRNYRAEANAAAARAIDGGLETLEKKVRGSERKATEFRVKSGLVSANGRLVTEQQITDINNQLSTARVEKARAQSKYDEMTASAGDPQSIPEALLSPTLRSLRAQLAAVSGQRARLSTQMLPRHPAMAAVNRQESELRGQIERELDRVVGSARHDVERASATEASLAATLDGLRGELNTASGAQITMRELDRDLEVNRALYEQALARTRQAREQVRLDTTNVRVITPPVPVVQRAFPPRRLLLLIGGFAFGLAGAAILIAFLVDRRHRAVRTA
jgi:succinoglycan biosynthesis transport protein ExoP